MVIPHVKIVFGNGQNKKIVVHFAEKSLLCDDDELKDIQHMRGLLEHRTRIVRQVEEAYQENDELHRKKRELKRGIIALNDRINFKKQQGDKLAKNVRELRATRNQISGSLCRNL